MAKQFISFLGTNNYLKCNYFLNEKKIKNVHFIQEAIIRLEDWELEDKITIFLTDEAERKNWNDNGQGKASEGLKTRLKKLNLKAKIITVNIKEGKNENELWDIFDTVYDNIELNSEIIFDITHGFRSLPLLAIILLNYAQFLKKIKIKAIYYGAFESLGPAYNVRNLPVEQRNAPIFDLTPFASLFDWTQGINEFLSFGSSKRIKKLSYKKLKPILKESKGKDESAKNLRLFMERIENFAQNICTNRGKDIIKFDGEKLFSTLQNVKTEMIKPLAPLFKRIEEKIQEFKQDDIRNGYKAVRWCIEHGLIQQGYTILQETMISEFLLANFPKKEVDNIRLRELVSKAVKIKNQNIQEKDWKDIRKDEKDIIYQFINSIDNNKARLFDKVTYYRNDINHAGFTKSPRRYSELEKNLRNIYNSLNMEESNA